MNTKIEIVKGKTFEDALSLAEVACDTCLEQGRTIVSCGTVGNRLEFAIVSIYADWRSEKGGAGMSDEKGAYPGVIISGTDAENIRLVQENAALRQQIEAMRNCRNCGHNVFGDYTCEICGRNDHWQMKGAK